MLKEKLQSALRVFLEFLLTFGYTSVPVYFIFFMIVTVQKGNPGSGGHLANPYNPSE